MPAPHHLNSDRRSPGRVLLDGLGWALIVVLAGAGTLAGFALLYFMQQRADPLLPSWAIPAAMSLGVPIVLALWKHPRAPGKTASTTLYLLSLSNAVTIAASVIMVPASVADALRRIGVDAVEHLGIHDGRAQLISALGMSLADRFEASARTEPPRSNGGEVSPSATRPNTPASSAPPGRDGLYVNFDPNGTGITVPATLRGPSGERTVDYLFDTGATITTITPALASALGVSVPRDAPTQTFNTAKGPTETPMVYLDALSLGDVTINGVLVSVCESCATEHTRGLLGLNVTRNFVVEMDYQREQMHLDPRHFSREGDRSFDIRHVLDMKLVGSPEIYRGFVTWALDVENRSEHVVYDVVPRVDFTTGASVHAETIERLAPGDRVRVLARGRAFADGTPKAVEYVLSVARGRWHP